MTAPGALASSPGEQGKERWEALNWKMRAEDEEKALLWLFTRRGLFTESFGLEGKSHPRSKQGYLNHCRVWWTAAEQACHFSSLGGPSWGFTEEGLALCDAYNLAAPTGTSACLVCSLLDWVGRGTKERLVLFPSPPSPRINRWDGFSIIACSEG